MKFHVPQSFFRWPPTSPIMNITHSPRLGSLLAALLLWVPLAPAQIAVKSGDKIAFLGDSITAGGWSNPAGYVRLVIAGLEANGLHATPVPAGISGHKSDQMLARLERDVLSKQPQWMTLSCGVNDVWHGKRGVPLDDAMAKNGEYDEQVGERGTYQQNITAIINRATAAGVKPVILTATVIQENLDSKENGLLVPYNEFLRQLAQEKQVLLADLNALFQARIKAANQPGVKVLTSDGVHMAGEGDKLMALGVLQALGLNAAELEKAKAAWPALEAQAAEAARKAAEARKKADADKAAKQPGAPTAK